MASEDKAIMVAVDVAVYRSGDKANLVIGADAEADGVAESKAVAGGVAVSSAVVRAVVVSMLVAVVGVGGISAEGGAVAMAVN
ncbi:MAG: hypothetical protein AAFR63_08070 [Cyanobacteria bacterium J06631_6]